MHCMFCIFCSTLVSFLFFLHSTFFSLSHDCVNNSFLGCFFSLSINTIFTKLTIENGKMKFAHTHKERERDIKWTNTMWRKRTIGMWIEWRIHDLIEVACSCAYSFIYTLFHHVKLYSRVINDHFRSHTAHIWLIIPLIISFSLNLTRQLIVHPYSYMASELVLSFFVLNELDIVLEPKRTRNLQIMSQLLWHFKMTWAYWKFSNNFDCDEFIHIRSL